MAYSVKAKFTVDGPWQRETEFHRVCGQRTLNKMQMEQADSSAELRLKTLTAMLLEELHSLQEQIGRSGLPYMELAQAHELAYSAYLHAMSALSRKQPGQPIQEQQNAEALPIVA